MFIIKAIDLNLLDVANEIATAKVSPDIWKLQETICHILFRQLKKNQEPNQEEINRVYEMCRDLHIAI